MFRDTVWILVPLMMASTEVQWPKEHLCTLVSWFQFQCVQLKCKSALKFHFTFWCYGSYISVFHDLLISLKKIKGNFELNTFDSICPLNYQFNVMWCTKTTQIIHSNSYSSSIFTFSVNYEEYCKIMWYHHQCTMMRMVSWSPCQHPPLLLTDFPFLLKLYPHL